MSTAFALDPRGARRVQLAAQGLLRAPRRAARTADLLAAIERMGALQIDTIHVVARSPYLVLWSRLGAYPPAWLDELLATRQVFEYWAHEACFLPMADYPLYRHRMVEPGQLGWKYSHDWMTAHRAGVEALLDHVRAHGPVCSADFARADGQPGGGWWGWSFEKRALEMLFSAGRLMIACRRGFQRHYDLAERIVPDRDDARLPPRAAVEHALLLKAVRALGVTPARWIGDYFRSHGKRPQPDPAALAERGELLPVTVEGWREPWYTHPAHAGLLAEAAAGGLRATHTTLLSPFDPLVWDRERASRLWDFDYRIECYTPAARRRFGYFVLPILHRDALVGRLDAKAHRRAGVFEVKALYLEAGVRGSAALAAALARALAACAAWHGTPTVHVARSEPAAFGAALTAALASPA